jgi:zinc/manganese transport system substrate-binding protein
VASAALVAAQETSAELPSIVATTQVLGSVVRELVADDGVVTVLMDPGVDEHTWQPSARDSEVLFGADLIVANGLDLEEGLIDLLAQAEAAGVPIFRATDHVSVRPASGEAADHPADDEHTDGIAHQHALGDPHFWLDPLAMRDVVLALGPVLAATGIDDAERAAGLATDLEALDHEIAALIAPIPTERRLLVTGHGALGYFADRYGFRVVGTVIPGLSTSDEASARDIAELIAAIRDAGASVLFSDVTTPPSVAGAVAGETGLQLVELSVAQLPESGSYADLLRGLATTISEALAP